MIMINSSIMISKTAEYALRAVLFLARRPDDRLVRATDVAEGLGVPANYLSKILHTLARDGILVSERGPNGGFGLAVPAQGIPLSRVVELFDDLGPRQECLLGRPRCRDDDPCVAHTRWKETFDRVTEFFRETMVADLLGPNAPATRETPA